MLSQILALAFLPGILRQHKYLAVRNFRTPASYIILYIITLGHKKFIIITYMLSKLLLLLVQDTIKKENEQVFGSKSDIIKIKNKAVLLCK